MFKASWRTQGDTGLDFPERQKKWHEILWKQQKVPKRLKKDERSKKPQKRYV